MVHHINRRTAHVFRSELSVPLEQLQLMEGQDLGLVSPEDLLAGSIWSAKLGTHRPLADGLLEVMQEVLTTTSINPGPTPATVPPPVLRSNYIILIYLPKTAWFIASYG